MQAPKCEKCAHYTRPVSEECTLRVALAAQRYNARHILRVRPGRVGSMPKSVHVLE